MNLKRIFWAGILGGLAVTALMALARAAGITSLNIELGMGSFVTGSLLGPGTWLTGLGLHLLRSLIVAAIYAFFFEVATRRATWRIGLVFGAVQTLIDGWFAGRLAVFHPLMANPPVPPGLLVAPGYFAVHYGAAGVTLFMAFHLVYGAIVGGVYETRAQARGKRISEPEREEPRKAA